MDKDSFTDYLIEREDSIEFNLNKKEVVESKFEQFKQDKCKNCLNKCNECDLCNIVLDIKGNPRCENLEEFHNIFDLSVENFKKAINVILSEYTPKQLLNELKKYGL